MQRVFIAGPCVIESQDLLNRVAECLVRINKKFNTDIIFKSSFDKANRTSISSFRGPGIDRGLQMLSDIKERYGLRILTDIHESWQTLFRYRHSFAGRLICLLLRPRQDALSTSKKRNS